MSEAITLAFLQTPNGHDILSPAGKALYSATINAGALRSYTLRASRCPEEALVVCSQNGVNIRGYGHTYEEIFFSKHAGNASRFQTCNGEHKWQSHAWKHAKLDLIETLGRDDGPVLATFRLKRRRFWRRKTHRGYIRLFQDADFLVDGEASAFLDDVMIHFYAYLFATRER